MLKGSATRLVFTEDMPLAAWPLAAIRPGRNRSNSAPRVVALQQVEAVAPPTVGQAPPPAAAPPPWEHYYSKYGLCCSAAHRTGEDGVSRLLYRAGHPNKDRIMQVIEQAEEQVYADDLFA